MKLTSHNVTEIYHFCVGKEHEQNIPVEGVNISVNFNTKRLKESEENIITMLECLPDSFKKSGGGGMSFLNMCTDKNDDLWGEHQTIDKLVVLGKAIGVLDFLLPRATWAAHPGGMPYIVISTEKKIRKLKLKHLDK